MEEQQDQAKVLVEIKNVQAFRLLNNTRMSFCQGDLKIGFMSNQNISFLNILEFYYTLQKQLKTVRIDFQTHLTILLPHLEQGFIAIVIPRAGDEELIKLIDIFQETTTQFHKDQISSDEQLDFNIKNHAADIFTVPLIDDSTVIQYINLGGSILKKGFGWLGGIMASGVNKGGEYISGKIEKQEEKQVPTETKQKFENIKSKSTQYMQVSVGIVSNLLNPIVQKSTQIIDQKSQEIDQGNNQTLKNIKSITKATGNALSEAFSGLAQGAKEVGNALGKNTRIIVEKKYGEDYSKTFLGENEQGNKQQEEPQQGKANSKPQQKQNLSEQSFDSSTALLNQDKQEIPTNIPK